MASETYDFTPDDVCSTRILVSIDTGIITSVSFENGCAGNSQGIARLAVGMKPHDVLKKLRGVDCEGRGTSCPDQLARALQEYCATHPE